MKVFNKFFPPDFRKSLEGEISELQKTFKWINFLFQMR